MLFFSNNGPETAPKLMKTIYDYVSNINYDALVSLSDNNMKIVSPQDPKTPFFGPKMTITVTPKNGF